MLDLQTLVQSLKRPKLLVQAARFGLENYRRERDLLRLLGLSHVPKTRDAILMLLDAEKEINQQRKDHGSYYSYTRHIELLSAIMSETTLLNHRRQSLGST